MNRSRLFLAPLSVALLLALPAAAQRHGGGPPPGRGSSDSHGASAGSSTPGAASMSHQSPSNVLSHNTHLAGKLEGLLGLKPGDTTGLNAAAMGFEHTGQFVSAVHVSKNLGIPFDQLKAQMMGPPTESLGKAIHTLRPAADTKSETKRANKQATDDMNEAASETSSGA